MRFLHGIVFCRGGCGSLSCGEDEAPGGSAESCLHPSWRLDVGQAHSLPELGLLTIGESWMVPSSSEGCRVPMHSPCTGISGRNGQEVRDKNPADSGDSAISFLEYMEKSIIPNIRNHCCRQSWTCKVISFSDRSFLLLLLFFLIIYFLILVTVSHLHLCFSTHFLETFLPIMAPFTLRHI